MNSAPSASGVPLRHGSLFALVLPEDGARIASLLDTRSGVEFLVQPPASYSRPAVLDPWARFEASACAGIDDCLPTVSACGPETPGGPVPDHGDFWRLRYAVLANSENSLALAVDGYSRPLRLEKTFHLQQNSLHIRCSVCNISAQPVPFLYALHPLFAIHPGDRIVLPPEVATVTLNSSRSNRLGMPGDTIGWLHLNSSSDLSVVQPVSANTADMLYSSRLASGWCGLYRAQFGQGIVLRFDPKQLPYVGLWLSYGGWPEDPALPRQYAVAFEPTVAPHGSLAAAMACRQAPVLAPHASFEFSLSIEITTVPPLSYDEFAMAAARHRVPIELRRARMERRNHGHLGPKD